METTTFGTQGNAGYAANEARVWQPQKSFGVPNDLAVLMPYVDRNGRQRSRWIATVPVIDAYLGNPQQSPAVVTGIVGFLNPAGAAARAAKGQFDVHTHVDLVELPRYGVLDLATVDLLVAAAEHDFHTLGIGKSMRRTLVPGSNGDLTGTLLSADTLKASDYPLLDAKAVKQLDQARQLPKLMAKLGFGYSYRTGTDQHSGELTIIGAREVFVTDAIRAISVEVKAAQEAGRTYQPWSYNGPIGVNTTENLSFAQLCELYATTGTIAERARTSANRDRLNSQTNVARLSMIKTASQVTQVATPQVAQPVMAGNAGDEGLNF